MTRSRITTPSRLHFGLLGWGPDAPRQFGGVGLMIEAPGIEIEAEPSSVWKADGPLAGRILDVAERIQNQLRAEGRPVAPRAFRIVRAPHEHVGLGVGTQLSLAVARLLCDGDDPSGPDPARLAALSGRGLRSGIGLHGFAHGGLIVDGGRRSSEGIPPLLAHHPFPADWSILVIIPERSQGLHGRKEAKAFAELPPIPETTTDRLCRLVLLGLLPAVVEHDLPAFGAALTELQREVGRCFAPAQGGLFANAKLPEIVAELEARRLHGIGQSSWGPTLYAFSDEPQDVRERLASDIRQRFGFSRESVFWTSARNSGAALIV